MLQQLPGQLLAYLLLLPISADGFPTVLHSEHPQSWPIFSLITLIFGLKQHVLQQQESPPLLCYSKMDKIVKFSAETTTRSKIYKTLISYSRINCQYFKSSGSNGIHLLKNRIDLAVYINIKINLYANTKLPKPVIRLHVWIAFL